jgi:hypothetical protein
MPAGETIPPLFQEEDQIRFFIPPAFYPSLHVLPWTVPLDQWEGRKARLIPVKSGLSRHIVRFVESNGNRFAIKETTLGAARREFESYAQLMRREIHTLLPVGIIARRDRAGVVETQIGSQREERATGYLVTQLMEKVIPDSYLFRRGFSKENRDRIWDVVIELFVQLHGNGVYWGDASLANMLIHFSTEIVPELGRRTRLQAVLADAETVEVRPSLSDSLRRADVDFFLESMLWTEADLQASGVTRDPLITREDQHYITTRYAERYAVAQEIRSFELVTHIDVDKLLGNFDAKGYGKLLLQHINEHKWYLSERHGREVPLQDAAEHWYREIFKPVCSIFSDHGLLRFFPDKTASSLYVEIMEHKYFMSQKERRDVGLVAALEDYAARFGSHQSLRDTISSITEALVSIFGADPARSFLTL